MKICTKCGKAKEEDEFFSIPGGLYPKCKACLVSSTKGSGHGNRFGPDLVKSVTEAYLAGGKYREISRDYGVSITAISAMMKKAGVVPDRGRGRKAVI